MDERRVRLAALLHDMAEDGPEGEFFGEVCAGVLGLMPRVPNIPKKVFFPVSRLVVASYIDCIIISEGKVLLTLRETGDPYYKGWHFPGFCRQPDISPLADCQKKAEGELGGDFKVLEVEQLPYPKDHWDDPSGRPHHLTVFYHVTKWEGTPGNGQWFSEMPKDMVELQKPFWADIEPLLRASV